MTSEDTQNDEEREDGRDDVVDDPTEWVLKDRKRSILTRDDRDYILGAKDLSGDTEYRAQNRIRKRVDDGIRDLAFLSVTGYSDALRFSSMPPSAEGYVTEHAMKSVLEFWYSYVYDKKYKHDVHEGDDHIDIFTRPLESAIADVLEDGAYREVKSVEIEIDGTTGKQEYLRDKLLDDDVITIMTLNRYRDLADDDDRQQLATELAEADKNLRVYHPEQDEIRTIPPHQL